MKLKKGDFIELDYTGKVKGLDRVFDSTDEKVAKEAGIHQEGVKYKPVIICLGEGEVVKGLDEELEGKEVGKSFTIEVPPEKGFGKKDGKLMKIVNTNIFIKNNINPMPGLQVNLDDMMGIIRTVTGGRTIVDFNHPLAGKTLIYEVKIVKKITSDEEKLKGMLTTNLAIQDPDVKIENGTAKINSDVPDMFKEKFEEKVKRLIPSIKKVEYKQKKEEKTEEKKEETKKEEEPKEEKKK